MDLFIIFFNICLGLFIGGLIMSVISMVLAGTAIQHQSIGHMDHVDHIDHMDHIDHVDHIDHIDHIDSVDHLDHIDHIDHVNHIDHVDQLGHTGHLDKDHLHKISHFKDHGDSIGHKDVTPAPFMLLFSEFLLVFGISGIIYYYLLIESLKWIIFIITPFTSFLITWLISMIWKKIAVNRHYEIVSNEDIIGRVGEVVMDVDYKGGVIRIKSDTPMEYEKIHSKPLNPKKQFSKGQYVYICGKKEGYFLVDDKIRSEKEIKICPNCGTIIEKDSGLFCVYCGVKLS